MRIVNIMPNPRHMSYASSSSGGKTLKAGEIGPEIPLELIHLPLLQKDMMAGNIQIRLSVEDKVFIERMLVEGDKPLKKVKQAVRQKPKPKPKPKKEPKPSLAPQVVVKPKSGVPVIKDIKPDDLKGGGVSLSDLQASNTVPGRPTFDGKKSSLDQIAGHTKGQL